MKESGERRESPLGPAPSPGLSQQLALRSLAAACSSSQALLGFLNWAKPSDNVGSGLTAAKLGPWAPDVLFLASSSHQGGTFWELWP